MGRAWRRAAAYLPQYTDGTRRLGGPDEDAFTFAATALERAAAGGRSDPREAVVHALGTLGSLDATVLSALLGSPVRLQAPPADPSLKSALLAASSGTGPHWVVLSAGGVGHTTADLPPPGEGAVAFLFDDDPDGRPERAGPVPTWSEGSPTSLAPAFSWATRVDAARLVGDWAADPAQGERLSRGDAGPKGAGVSVSQGAFVPNPRYDESRRSRWRFEADRCGDCGARTFPARGRCRACGATDALAAERLPPDGWTVVASTRIGPGGQPTEFDAQVESEGPYGVVLAELSPDVRVTLQVAEGAPAQLRVGAASTRGCVGSTRWKGPGGTGARRSPR